MVTDYTDREHEPNKFSNIRCIYDFSKHFIVQASSKGAVGPFHYSLKLPTPKPYLLKGRNRSSDISSLLCLFNSLRSLFHSFLHTYPFAFKYGEWISVEFAYSKLTRITVKRINVGNHSPKLTFCENSRVALDHVFSENLG